MLITGNAAIDESDFLLDSLTTEESAELTFHAVAATAGVVEAAVPMMVEDGDLPFLGDDDDDEDDEDENDAENV